jgi:hypothetical protein
MFAVVEKDGEFCFERLGQPVELVFGIATGIVRTGIV